MTKISVELNIIMEECVISRGFYDNGIAKEGVAVTTNSLSEQELRSLIRENVKDTLRSLEIRYEIKEKGKVESKLLSVLDHMEFSVGDKFTIYAITN